MKAGWIFIVLSSLPVLGLLAAIYTAGSDNGGFSFWGTFLIVLVFAVLFIPGVIMLRLKQKD